MFSNINPVKYTHTGKKQVPIYIKFSKNIAGTLKSLLHITCTITPKHIINTQIKSNVKTIFN